MTVATSQTDDQFRIAVWEYFRSHERAMPWRDQPTFYYVLVSEIMLQQTQVARVLVKFQEFTRRFPTIETLASAPLAEVLRLWQGLGYNRRARYLHQAAQTVVASGQPVTRHGLEQLPGVGRNTAGAMMNYVYQEPTPYVETNIRSVYFYHYFPETVGMVSDSEVLALVERTLDREHPREWFWALMDYGTWLKANGQGRLQASRHYKKQSSLKGSLREMRGMLMRELAADEQSYDALETKYGRDDRFTIALDGLMRDGLVARSGGKVHLTKD